MSEIQKLIKGFKRFQANYFGEDRKLFEQLREGQSPATMVIACSDSRVDPAILLDCQPGDLFMVRNVANLVPPYEQGAGLHGVSTALEFGVCVLGVRHLIVLGHSSCGGIRALMQGIPAGTRGEFITGWVNIAARAKERILAEMPDALPEKQCCACEKASILVSLENLLTFPWIRERVERGVLTLHGWYFNIDNGELVAYDAKRGHFAPLHIDHIDS
ncbi:MAG: carbonic anhydrase [Methylophilaceae bacterium]|nr:carbonic anhydrase [Methylophilaceae bacterium]